MMHSKLLLSGLLMTTSVQVFQAQAAETRKEGERNILFIAVDDLKPLLGCYGDPLAKTPHIDKLAARGTLFTAAYCQQAVSGPTRASLLTGMCPDRTRVWDLKTLIRAENPDVLTLPQHFKNNRYEVAGIGKIYDPRSVDKGIDELSWSQSFINSETYLNPAFGKPVGGHYQGAEVREQYAKYKKEAAAKGLKNRKAENYVLGFVKPSTESASVPDDAYLDGATAKGAVEFIRTYKQDKPFFLAVGFKKPHLPFCAPERYWQMYKREEMPLATFRRKAAGSPDFAYHNSGELQSYTDIPSLASFSDIENLVLPDSKARELIHGYYASVSYTDALIGQVIDALEKKGLAKNTLIVLWGDHGWHLGDHGLWNKHSNFEQATHVPMLIIDPSAPAKEVKAPVEFLDIYPTLCDLAGIDRPSHLDGQSLAAVVKGDRMENTLRPYAVSQYPRVGKMGYSLRNDRYRYTIWVKWADKKTDIGTVYAEELYDYAQDPNETVNRASDPAYSDALKQMQHYWAQYVEERIQK